MKNNVLEVIISRAQGQRKMEDRLTFPVISPKDAEFRFIGRVKEAQRASVQWSNLWNPSAWDQIPAPALISCMDLGI